MGRMPRAGDKAGPGHFYPYTPYTDYKIADGETVGRCRCASRLCCGYRLHQEDPTIPRARPVFERGGGMAPLRVAASPPPLTASRAFVYLTAAAKKSRPPLSGATGFLERNSYFDTM